MEKEQFKVFYFGEDLFTGKIVETLFSKKGIQVQKVDEEQKLSVYLEPEDILLVDLPALIKDRKDIHQVLISYEPTSSPFLKYWCKTPMNEANLHNLLFYRKKNDYLLSSADNQFSFSTRKIDSFLGDDEESKKEVIAEFIENLHTNYRKLETHTLLNDTHKVQDVAHKMLSSAEYYEVAALNKRLKTLENGDGRLTITQEELDQLVEEIYDQVVQLRTALIKRFF